MEETLETPGPANPAARGEDDDRTGERPRSSSSNENESAAPIARTGSPFFADLVRAHYAWERGLGGTEGARGRRDELGDVYHAKLKKFCAREGPITESYWCTRKPSAIVLTEKPPMQRPRFLREPEIRIHRLNNWLMPRSSQPLVDLLHKCDDLAIQADEILRGTPRRIALRSVYAIESDVLAFLERTRGQPKEPEVEEFAEEATRAVKAAETRYEDAADKVARMVYVSGMMAGFILLAPLAALSGLLISIFGALDLHAAGTQAFFACIAAGGLGAVVSVLSRMASPKKFDIDPEVGRQALIFLGIFRPFVGAVFGLALYFLLQSSLLQVSSDNKFATYVVAAFLGGFSERFVKVMLNGAEDSLGASKAEEPQPQTRSEP
jgi:hypothetical protein